MDLRTLPALPKSVKMAHVMMERRIEIWQKIISDVILLADLEKSYHS
jgi:hypothetical protein